MNATGPDRFVSRAGAKLDAAVDAFDLDVSGRTCADFGCNVGGFTDCLLQRDARRVYAVDTGYGELAWKLRKDARVVVLERTNALHVALPETVDIVTIDVAWTPQEKILPSAMAALRPDGRVVSLLKPHYEAAKIRGRKPHKTLTIPEARMICREVCGRLARMGIGVLAVTESILRGKGGNMEFLVLCGRRSP